ncbi:MAG: MTAP family purine nucleoside phosphorylase [Chloroflexi bacterium]|nr:MTAP family purine nucleoside phosphorylase [Chloroflexota bacterium]
MRIAIIGGTNFNEIPELMFSSSLVDTRFGQVQVFLGEGKAEELVFLPRHGPGHHVPPHRINYRANMLALKKLGVKRALATFAVGSLSDDYPPGSVTVLDQFLDFTSGREATFFDGGESGLVHTEVSDPFCQALRARIIQLAASHEIPALPGGTYVGVNGPRFETAAEVRMYAQLGGHVVGMTGVPEISLARELGIHYAAVALSINWGAGLKGAVKIDNESLNRLRPSLTSLFLEVLGAQELEPCMCERSALTLHPPSEETGV